jgi:hypothetical protein
LGGKKNHWRDFSLTIIVSFYFFCDLFDLSYVKIVEQSEWLGEMRTEAIEIESMAGNGKERKQLIAEFIRDVCHFNLPVPSMCVSVDSLTVVLSALNSKLV